MTTAAELQALLSPDEVQYPPLAARLDADAVPALRELATGEDTLLASKAIYLASLIEGAEPIVTAAATSADPVLQAAAASGVTNLAGTARLEVARALLDTDDVAVQKVTLRGLGPDLPAALQDRVRQLARAGEHRTVRDLAARRLDG